MRKSVVGALILVAVFLLGFPPFSSGARAAQQCEEWVVWVESVQGSVEARKPGENEWRPVELNDTYCSGVVIRTLDQSRAAVVTRDETILRLQQNTIITFSIEENRRTSLIDFLKGVAHFFSRTARGLEVDTPYVNALVEGTEFIVKVERDCSFITTFEGRLALRNDLGNLKLPAGKSAVAEAGSPPRLQTVVRPRDAVNWALYYPPVLEPNPDDFPEDQSEWPQKVRSSIDFYRKNDLARALDAISGIPEDVADFRFFVYRAALLLAVGSVDAASEDLDRALELDPENGEAIALQSVIAVAQNDKERALQLAEKAVALDSATSAPRIALSYAKQARFDVEGALESLKEAVRLEPGNSLVWARLSEMWLSVGNLDRSLEAAMRAVELNPDFSRTQTVLGFSYLARIDTRKAKECFNKAIRMDQADPLPRLGLGLAMIRDGDLKGGRRQIEIAVSLDPNNSLIRSYLGKAYFDEKRDKHAAEQLSIARELDPKDPTPWFYDAIRKQSINRPVEALEDLQQSIRLNDNRAVYRSRLLLDQDLAARSASLARIYDDLGFEQKAMVEGWKSLAADPTDYSAHRFLSDLYASRPRHEVARVSELLQSQLLQPLNLTPLQPQLAVDDLAIREGAGPSQASFSEFNPLFVRNRLALQTDGVVGGNGAFGEDVVQSGLWGKTSYSLGQFHYETEGFRDNNDLEEDIYNGFVQVSLSPKLSVQTEVRHMDVEKGDLPLRFFADSFLPTLRQVERENFERLGFHYAFGPDSQIISSFMHHRLDFDTSLPEHQLDIEGFDEGYLAEMQHLFRSNRFHLISGFGHFKGEREEVINLILPPAAIVTLKDTDRLHSNLYLYALVDYPKGFTWTLGVSGDYFSGSKDIDQFNPKLGIVWTLFPDTSLRAAFFRVLKRTLVSQQTLEPTQVAGFNQFFDEDPGASSWTYGLGIDQKIRGELYGGFEIFRREMDVPFENMEEQQTETAEWSEDSGRAYLYWMALDRLALSFEYQFERFERTPEMPGVESIVEIETHRFPLGMSFFHTCGLNAKIRGTFVYQRGEFLRDPGDTVGDDQFFVVDSSIGYRLPKRLGVIEVVAKNLFNEAFSFQDTNPAKPVIYPEMIFLCRYTLDF